MWVTPGHCSVLSERGCHKLGKKGGNFYFLYVNADILFFGQSETKFKIDRIITRGLYTGFHPIQTDHLEIVSIRLELLKLQNHLIKTFTFNNPWEHCAVCYVSYSLFASEIRQKIPFVQSGVEALSLRLFYTLKCICLCTKRKESKKCIKHQIVIEMI